MQTKRSQNLKSDSQNPSSKFEILDNFELGTDTEISSESLTTNTGSRFEEQSQSQSGIDILPIHPAVDKCVQDWESVSLNKN